MEFYDNPQSIPDHKSGDTDVAGVFVMLRGKQVLGGVILTASDRGVITLCTSFHKQALLHRELKPTQVLMVDKFSRLPLKSAVVLFMIAGGGKKFFT